MVRNRLKILGKTERDIDALESSVGLSAHASVNAPISGTITDRQVGPGQYIQAGAANPVFSIGDISSLWLMAQVREVDAPHMKVGAPVEVRVLAVPGKVYSAKVVAIAPVVDVNTRRVALRALISNADGALKPEMFANFRIITGNEKQSPGVPESAVVFEGDTARVWVAGDNGTLGLRNITVGRRSGNMLEGGAGLNIGEKIVTSGTLVIDRAARGDSGARTWRPSCHGAPPSRPRPTCLKKAWGLRETTMPDLGGWQHANRDGSSHSQGGTQAVCAGQCGG